MKKITSIILAIIMLFSTVVIANISVTAANYTTKYWNYTEPSGADYAYWNGKKMVKHKNTWTTNIKWMQASLNYCISERKLDASYLDVDGKFGPACKKVTIKFQEATGLSADGSFGPATIKKMKSVLNNDDWMLGDDNYSSSEITTSDIQRVLNKYGYKTNTYWTYKSGGSPTSSYMATSRKGRNYSYRYNGVECYGFANFVMHEVTGTTVNPNNGNKYGWKYLKAKDVKSLKVGDIVRIGSSNSNGHTGIVLTINKNGVCTFAQCLGGVNNKISIGTKLASSKFGSHNTLKSMKNSGALLYVYRYVG